MVSTPQVVNPEFCLIIMLNDGQAWRVAQVVCLHQQTSMNISKPHAVSLSPARAVVVDHLVQLTIQKISDRVGYQAGHPGCSHEPTKAK